MAKRRWIDATQVQELKDSIIGKTCNNACDGVGEKREGNTFVECSCKKQFLLTVNYIGANIPKRYWDFTFRNLLKKFTDDNNEALLIIKRYVENLPMMVERGAGLYIQGSVGLAKSALAYYILKEAIKKEIPCYAIRMSKLSKFLVDSMNDSSRRNLIRWIRKDVKVLLIDEIEKDYKIDEASTYIGSQVNEFFGDIYDANKSLLITSNKPKTLLKGIQADNVIDRLQELIDVILVGDSYRGSKLENLL